MIYFSNASQVVQDSISKLKSYNKSELDKLRDKCIDYYQYSNTKSYIDDYFGGTLQDEIPLYTTNMTRRLIERISLVYKEPPLRGIEDENYALYTEDKDYMLKKIERMHNLLGTIALHICWNENGKFSYHPIIKFEPVFDKSNPMEPVAIVYPVPKTVDSVWQNQEDEYIYWDSERHFRYDSTGKVIHINEEDLNPFGVLPFVFIQPNHQVDEFFTSGRAEDICIANQQIDIAMTMLNHHIRSAGGQYVIEGQVDANAIQLGLNKIVALDNGSMSNVSSQTNIPQIVEGIKFQLQQVAINHHINFDFGVNGSKSGVALKIENIELLEAREDDVEKYRRAEKQIFNIENAILEAMGIAPITDELVLDYAEVNFPDFEQEMSEWDWKFKHGIADVIDYLIAKDPDKFDDQPDKRVAWEEWLAERKRSKDNVKRNGDSEENAFTFGAPEKKEEE